MFDDGGNAGWTSSGHQLELMVGGRAGGVAGEKKKIHSQSQLFKLLDRIQRTVRITLQISEFEYDLKRTVLKLFIFGDIDSLVDGRSVTKASVLQ